MYKLQYVEGGVEKIFEMCEENLKKSEVFNSMLENMNDDSPIPLMENYIDEKLLTYLNDYLTYHVKNPKSVSNISQPLKHESSLKMNGVCEFDENFVRNMEKPYIFKLTQLSNYLDIPELLELMCCTIAFHLKNCSSIEEMQTYMNM